MPNATHSAVNQQNPNGFGCTQHGPDSTVGFCTSGKATSRDDLYRELECLLNDEEVMCCIRSLNAIRSVFRKHNGNLIAELIDTDLPMTVKDSKFMENLNRVINSSYTDPDLGLDQLASEMAMCGRQLQRKLKMITQKNPLEHLRCFRLDKARDLLSTGQPIGLVAGEVGFSSPAYFACCFKAHFSITPSEFQLQIHSLTPMSQF